MRLNKYLTEKLNLSTPVKVVANNNYTWQAQFKVADSKFQFVADLDDEPGDSDPKEWGITFWNMSHPGDFTLGSTELTGDVGTSSLKVFSGVASAFKKFIQARKPEMFFFSAEEKSRVNLYNRLSKMLAQQFKYKLKKSIEDGDAFYEFNRK